MSFVFQFAGKARPERAQDIKQVFGELEIFFRRQPGFERAKLLVSYATLQVQLLYYWRSYEDGLAFSQGEHGLVASRLLPLMEGRATLITSVVERELGRGTIES